MEEKIRETTTTTTITTKNDEGKVSDVMMIRARCQREEFCRRNYEITETARPKTKIHRALNEQ